jgi:FdhE protein
MLWPHARSRVLADPELVQRLAEGRRQHPESEAWLGMVEAALAEGENDGVWEGAVPATAADRPARAPLLHRSHMTVAGRPARRWVRRLLELDAPLLEGLDPGRLDATALLEAAVCQDDAWVDAIATTAGAPASATPALRVVAQMAALPLLQACGRKLAPEVPSTWWEGYCPVCGAWPTLAEFRGLEHKRWLRCGRCGTGWEVSWLRCPFCDETNHENLGYLAPEEGEPTRKAEVCDRCKGYVKAEATVRPLRPWEVLLEDLTTVALDVAALDRGYHRPERTAYSLEARVVER